MRRFPYCAAVAGIVSLLCQPSFSMPVWGMQSTLAQPDGSQVAVKVWGDEFYRVIETLDGYTVVRDAVSGVVCYARVSADQSKLESTGIAVGSAAKSSLGLTPHLRIAPEAAEAQAGAARAQLRAVEKNHPMAKGGKSVQPAAVGPIKGLCLLVDFSDDVATVPAATFDNFLNQVGYTGNGNHGSVRDYYYDVSDGALTYTNVVPPTYYRAAHPRSYYEDPNVSFGVRASELILEALQKLESDGHNFAQYDANGDTYIDAINCFYAGDISPDWSVGLWPHSSAVFGFSADGVNSGRYQMTNIGAYPLLGTFCHENGHMVCLFPDLYDYGFDSAGVGIFCLMAYQGPDNNPVEPCAPLKSYAGWATVTDLTGPQTGLSLTAGANQFFRLPHPTLSSEYYMAENRNASARDAGLPGSGLALWHVDELGSNDNQQMLPDQHYLVTLVQADGLWDLEHRANYGDANDLFRAAGVSQCGPITTPNTNWWDGNISLARFFGISAPGATMTFNYEISQESVFVVLPRSITRTLSAGSVASPDSIDIYNASPSPVSYTLAIANESHPGVFSIKPTSGASGQTHELHTLSYAAENLPYGTYTATLVLDGAAGNAPMSIPLHITVVPSLAEALDYDSVSWSGAGNAPWNGTLTAGVYDGDSAKSGMIADNQSSVLQTEVYGPASGSFYWRVSSESGYDFLRFYIDGAAQPGSISGVTAWALKTFSVSAGPHTLKWAYEKDGGLALNEDAAGLDRVNIVDNACAATPDCPAASPLGHILGEPVCLTVPCPLWGADTFAWSKDGVPLSDDSRISGALTRTLRIESLDASDEGLYTCDYSRGLEPVGTYSHYVRAVESLPAPNGRIAALAILAVLALGLSRLYRTVRRRHSA